MKRIRTDDYLTAFVLKIDEYNRVTFANASHTEVIHQKYKTNEIKLLDAHGLFIAAMQHPDNAYENNETKLHSGDRLFLYTDGLIEHKNLKGEEFGMERALKIIKDMKNASLDDTKQALVDALKKFMGKAPLKDDVSLLVLEINKNWSAFIKQYRLGVTELKNENSEKAIELFEECLKLIPSFPNIYYMLSKAYFKSNMLDKAKTSIEHFYNIKSDDINGLKLFTQILIREGDHDQAKEKIDILQSIMPKNQKSQDILQALNKQLNNIAR